MDALGTLGGLILIGVLAAGLVCVLWFVWTISIGFFKEFNWGCVAHLASPTIIAISIYNHRFDVAVLWFFVWIATAWIIDEFLTK
jgi:hypothetical protein